MPRFIGTARAFMHALVAVGTLVGACSKGSSEQTRAATAPSTAAPETAPRAAASSVQNPLADASPVQNPLADAAISQRLNAHYAKYVDGSDFRFYRDDWAPTVEHFRDEQNVSSDALASQARTFYAHKQHVSLRVKPGSVQTKMVGGRMVASFVLTMAWTVAPPPAARACGSLDEAMQWTPSSRIAHTSDVNAEITLDADGRFVTYDERGALRPRLRVNNHGTPLVRFSSLPMTPARDLDADAGVAVADGTVVEDLGDTFACGLASSEVDTVRKVRVAGSEGWLLASWAASTGHSYVGEDVLVPAQAAQPNVRAGH